MKMVPEYFGCLVFDDRTMKAKLPPKVYTSLKKTIDGNAPLDMSIVDEVARAMKEWAVANGATHYTHWAQPLNSLTAEKHESFVRPASDGGILMGFTGKELIRGEADGSSFPNGGIRHTAYARGYTTWDPTSYAFIKDRTLCIPAVLCAYTGEALDNKTPLLRSIEALNKQALRVLRLFGKTSVKSVRTMVGPEQEYFLVDKEMYEQRPDLKFAGRTLFGAKSPKGHELDDHYYGALAPRVSEFMGELNEELWKMGIMAKTEHNEVPPSGHEMAPVYTLANLATDQNQITMELMQKIAVKHGLVCLLSEKPIAAINGNGKHNNWSIGTDEGENLLDPGDKPYENIQFLVFLCAIIKAVDDYQDLLRISVAYAGNDHRLGAHEAPPAIVSVFLGEVIQEVVDAVAEGRDYKEPPERIMDLGAAVLPKFTKDSTDRNRTSPFAFTGNKFEFRLPGSSQSIGMVNTVLNAAVAESLKVFADRLEKIDDHAKFETSVKELLKETICAHKRIIFMGNAYSDEWVAEAQRRGLLNLKTTPECFPRLMDRKNVDMLISHGIFTERELQARCDIGLDTYCKTRTIEAETMLYMAWKMIIPAVSGYTADLARAAAAKKALDGEISASAETELVKTLSSLTDDMAASCARLKSAVDKSKAIEDLSERADFCRDTVLAEMDVLRKASDAAEALTDKDYWPLPVYGDLLYSERL